MDITTRKDIELLINRFYDRVKKDPIIGFIFNDVMKVNWDEHLPVMFDFWDSMLLGGNNYKRNAMGIHFEVNRKVKLQQEHFDRWVKLFTETADSLFEGEVVNEAKKRAVSIAQVMLFKLSQDNGGLTITNPGD